MGNAAIEESLAYLIESRIYNTNSPEFPYKTVTKLVNFVTDKSIPEQDLIVIITLSLLSLNPPLKLYSLIKYYDSTCRDITDNHKKHALLIEKVEKEFTEGIKVIRKELVEIEDLTKDRGILELSSKAIKEKFESFIALRRSNFLFDLTPFIHKSSGVDEKALEKLFNQIYPCDVIQKEYGPENTIERDSLYSFDQVSKYLMPFYATIKYVFAHLSSEGFKNSDKAHCKCPFYTVCGKSYRKDYPSLCETKPWELYEIQEEFCWFNQGVASLLGTSNIEID